VPAPRENQIWTSSAQVASHLVILARTAPPSDHSRSSGLSLFFAPIRDAPHAPGVSAQQSALRKGVEMRRIEKMGGNCVDANEVRGAQDQIEGATGGLRLIRLPHRSGSTTSRWKRAV
jgi:acyl-CoA dehydrogenase